MPRMHINAYRIATTNFSEMIVLTAILLICCGIWPAESTLISQSVLQRCIVGDSSEPQAKDGHTCAKKFVVSMTLRGGQRETDSIYANINSAFDKDKEQSNILKKPYRIEIQKSDVVANYRVYFRGTANALPTEHIIIFSNKECTDHWFEDDVTCGKYRDKNGTTVWDSQGFCCRCNRIQGFLPRANNAKCFGQLFELDRASVTGEDGEIYNFKSSAHCMNVSELWYDVFDIESPNLHYEIRVNLLVLEVELNRKKEPVYSWKLASNFTFSPDKTSGRSADGRVIAELQGDLLGGRGLMDLSAKNLLIPSLRAWHLEHIPEEYVNGPPDWLLVDKFLVDLSGRECNKIGLDFTGFRNQPGRCFLPPDSCFSNQPSMLWRADDERRRRGIKGFYMMHNYGKIHPSTHPTNSSFIMRLIYPELHNSFVTFRLDASDLKFVVNVGKGRIVTAESRGFNRSTKTAGEVVVVVENIADIAQDFNVVLTKCFGRESLPSKRVSLYPGESTRVSFALIAHNVKKITTNCEVQLFDQRYSLLGTARLTFSVDAPCFCFGICDCVCDERTGIVTEKACPTPPPIKIDVRSTAAKITVYILELIGLHGIVCFFGTLLLCLGMIKLVCGGVIFCRKSKAQEHYDLMREKGVPLRSPQLAKCSGYCSGALAAKAKIKRKAERMRKMGKEPHRYDDWTNMSYTCYCNAELTDIRCMNIIKALCFFYYLLILPFIWLGKKIWWGLFADTATKKKSAEKAVIKAARKRGPEELEKLGVVSIQDELAKYKRIDSLQEKGKREKLQKEKERVKAAERDKMAKIFQKSLQETPPQPSPSNREDRMSKILQASEIDRHRLSVETDYQTTPPPSGSSSPPLELKTDNLPRELVRLKASERANRLRDSLSLNVEVEAQTTSSSISPPQEVAVALELYNEVEGVWGEDSPELQYIDSSPELQYLDSSPEVQVGEEKKKKKKKHKRSRERDEKREKSKSPKREGGRHEGTHKTKEKSSRSKHRT